MNHWLKSYEGKWGWLYYVNITSGNGDSSPGQIVEVTETYVKIRFVDNYAGKWATIIIDLRTNEIRRFLTSDDDVEGPLELTRESTMSI